MASGLQSQNSDLVLNANNGKVVFQENGVNLPESLTPNGYTKLPNGLILQWGQVPSATYGANTNTAVSITFPVSFQNAAFISTYSLSTKNVNSAFTLSATKSLTGLDMNVNNSSASSHTSSIDWFAIGY